MASFPQLGSVTVCESSRKLITAESCWEDRAEEACKAAFGVVFSPIHAFDYQASLHPDRCVELPVNWSSALPHAVSYGPLKRLLGPDNVKLVDAAACVSWHTKLDILGVIVAPNQVMIRDYGNSGQGEDPCILIHDLQRDAKCLEWQPYAGKILCVGCRGGICIWAASHPGNRASVRPGFNSGSPVTGFGVCWTLVDFLRGRDGEQITSLSWSPDGRYLASASHESSSVTLWDITQGIGTPIRRGLGRISLLKWSPTGDYLCAGKLDGSLYLWETKGWNSKAWSCSGFVTGAAWGPSGTMLLIAFSESVTLGCIHFATNPPSHGKDLLPVELPGLRSLTNSPGIEKIAWDAAGERLAVSYKDGNDLYKGLIAIYDVKMTTLLFTPSLIGFIRGPGDDPKPLTFSFHNKYKLGPLLSVCWSTGSCMTYPLLIREGMESN